MSITPRSQRLMITLLASAVVLTLAWCAANILSGWYFLQRMERLSADAEIAMQTVNLQIDQSLSTLQNLEVVQSTCDDRLYAGISEIVAANRFIYEAAVQLSSGKVCTSYGREVNQLPTNGHRRYQGKLFDYWFLAGENRSPDSGFVIVSQNANYVWLNKGILLNALHLDEGVGFDLFDTNRQESVFSSGGRHIESEAIPTAGSFSLGRLSLYYTRTNQWHGLASLLTLSRSEYEKVWWGVFVIVLGSSILAPVVLFRSLRWGRQRYRSIAPKLRKALKHNEFRLNYQPIVNLNTGDWVGVESLLRWSPRGKPLSPAVFVPALEQAGMIGEVTRWVIRRVVEDYSRYLCTCNGLYITVNLSAQDIEDPTFVDFVRDLLAHYDVPARVITFEVTESVLLDRKIAAEQLQRLRDQGHRIAIDDFGTGYSSLSYISELPIDILKIDRSFLDPVKMHENDALWRHVVSMANTLSLTIVAEGVEQEVQACALINEGVTFAQGWLYAKDLPPETLAKQFFHIRA